MFNYKKSLGYDEQQAILDAKETYQDTDHLIAALLAFPPIGDRLPEGARMELVCNAIRFSTDGEGNLVIGEPGQQPLLAIGYAGPTVFLAIDAKPELGKKLDVDLANVAKDTRIRKTTELGHVDLLSSPSSALLAFTLDRCNANPGAIYQYAFPGGIAATVKTIEDYLALSLFDKSKIANVVGEGRFAKIVPAKSPMVRQSGSWINGRLKILEVMLANSCPTFYQKVQDYVARLFAKLEDKTNRFNAASILFFNLEQYYKGNQAFDTKLKVGAVYQDCPGLAPASADQAQAFFQELGVDTPGEDPAAVFTVLEELKAAFECSHFNKPGWFCQPDISFAKDYLPSEKTLQHLVDKKLIHPDLANFWRKFIADRELMGRDHTALSVLITTSYVCHVPIEVMTELDKMCKDKAGVAQPTRPMFSGEIYRGEVVVAQNLMLAALMYQHELELTLAAVMGLELVGMDHTAGKEAPVNHFFMKQFFCRANEVRLDWIENKANDASTRYRLVKAFWAGMTSAIEQEAAKLWEKGMTQQDLFAKLMSSAEEGGLSAAQIVMQSKLKAAMVDPYAFYTELFPVNEDGIVLDTLMYSTGIKEYTADNEEERYALEDINLQANEAVEQATTKPAMNLLLKACVESVLPKVLKSQEEKEEKRRVRQDLDGRRSGVVFRAKAAAPAPAPAAAVPVAKDDKSDDDAAVLAPPIARQVRPAVGGQKFGLGTRGKPVVVATGDDSDEDNAPRP